jgi:hypothetical protein
VWWQIPSPSKQLRPKHEESADMPDNEAAAAAAVWVEMGNVVGDARTPVATDGLTVGASVGARVGQCGNCSGLECGGVRGHTGWC